MPLDPRIALEVKPVDIKPVDWNQTFRTLAQIKHLQANTEAAQQEAARKQQLFDETAGAGEYLSSLGRGSSPTLAAPAAQPYPGAQTGGPPFDEATLGALKQGQSTPPPGSPAPAGPGQGAPGAPAPGGPQATQPRLSILDPEVHAELYKRSPHIATDLIKGGLDIQTSRTKLQQDQLELAAKLFEHGTRSLALVNDAESYQAWRLGMETLVPPQAMAVFPATYSPQAVARLQQSAQDGATQLKQRIEQAKLDNETMNAQTNKFRAETERQAEKRQGTELTYQPSVEGTVPAPKYGVGGVTPGTPVPGTARPLTPAEAQAQWHVDKANSAHATATQLENAGTSGTGIVQKTLSGVPGVGNYLTPADAQKYSQAKLAFLTAVNRGTPPAPAAAAEYEKEYFPQPGETNPQVIKQKQEARAIALRGLQIETNRPVGVTPPGLRPKQGTAPGTTPAATPHTLQVYTRAQVSALATKHGMSEASIEALIRADGDRVAP